MLELRVRSNAYFLLFDDVFHLLLYGAVVGLDSLFHILIAIIVNECVDCRYWLVCRFLCCYLIGVNHNLGMENLLVDALSEIVRYSTDKDTLRQCRDFARWD